LSYEESITMFRATVGYYEACQPNSASKRVMLDFIIRAFMVKKKSLKDSFCN
jgi:hypothetical protein